MRGSNRTKGGPRFDREGRLSDGSLSNTDSMDRPAIADLDSLARSSCPFPAGDRPPLLVSSLRTRPCVRCGILKRLFPFEP